MEKIVENFPLSWPDEWPRTANQDRKEARFGKRAGRRISVAQGLDRLFEEMRRIDSRDVIISTNVRPRYDGLPNSTDPTPVDPGVAVYFGMSGLPLCLATDKWNRVGDNLAALAAHLKSLRDQSRWGVGSKEQAYRGYVAIPPPPAEPMWWEVLGVDKRCQRHVAHGSYRRLALIHHTDLGGSKEAMAKLNIAWEVAKLHFECMESVEKQYTSS